MLKAFGGFLVLSLCFVSHVFG